MQVGMQPGPYQFTASKEGYQPAITDNFKIGLGDPTGVPDFKLLTAKAAANAPGGELDLLRKAFTAAVELQNAGKLDEAIAAYKAIIEKNPDVPEVHLNLGTLYSTKKDTAAAEAEFQKALELRPGYSDAAASLARLYQSMGQADKAMAIMDQGDRCEPAATRRRSTTAASYLMNGEKTEEAAKAFEAATTADPNMADAFYWLGSQLLNLGRNDEAIKASRSTWPEPGQPAAGGGRPGHPGRDEEEEVIADRVAAVRERIARAAERASRPPGSVTLVAVSKTFPAGAVRAAFAAGVRDFGENRVQEAEPKIAALAPTSPRPGCAGTWSGTCSRTRPRRAAALFDVRPVRRLARARRGGSRARPQQAGPRRCACWCRSTSPARRRSSGSPEAQLFGAARGAARHGRGCRVEGLMLLPPFFDDPERSRPFFRRLRALARRRRRAEGLLAGRELSMGMSHDFEVAIEEGATIVRVGTAIFGEPDDGGVRGRAHGRRSCRVRAGERADGRGAGARLVARGSTSGS